MSESVDPHPDLFDSPTPLPTTRSSEGNSKSSTGGGVTVPSHNAYSTPQYNATVSSHLKTSSKPPARSQAAFPDSDLDSNPPRSTQSSVPLLKAMDIRDTTDLNPIVQIWMPAQQRIAPLRSLILVGRVDVIRERARCKQQEELFERLVNAFIATLEAVRQQGSYFQRTEELGNLARQITLARDDLRRVSEKRAVFEDSLSNQEYKLTELEKEIYSELDAELRSQLKAHTSDISHSYSPSEGPVLSGNPVVESEANLNLLDELYSRIGDLRNFLELLNDFEYDLRQELDERDLLRATGQTDMTSDEQFFEGAKVERDRIERELEKAKRDVNRLKDLCKNQGIEFEDVHFSNLQQKVDTEIVPSTSLLVDPDSRLGSSQSSIYNTFVNARERVRNWLKLSDNSQEPHTGTAGLEPSESRSDAWEIPTNPCNSRRPSSVKTIGNDYPLRGPPEWNFGPPAGSPEIQALLLESAAATLQPRETQASEVQQPKIRCADGCASEEPLPVDRPPERDEPRPKTA
ncbi:hypothetical protein CC78DRAFT_576698 [Lojkania enalia]|uniref:Uncharacterized protein n=1 Tax=Lojkania enalia TaxID=147567 RepID=A0A9P4KGS3_9PLEO|nr:hypothetical protein CC78DRAFT_576698 [Didymosphaeria enalia]